MERYAKVQSSLWTSSKKFKELNITERYVYLYLLTCQHGNSAGIYRMIPNYSAYDCSMELEDFNRAIIDLCKANLISFDSDNNVVLIHQYMKFNPITNEKHAKGTSKVAKEFIESSVYSVWAKEVVAFYKGLDSCIDSPIDSEPIQQNTDNRIQITEKRKEITEKQKKKTKAQIFQDELENLLVERNIFEPVTTSIKEFVENRKAIKKPMTILAVSKFLNKLEKETVDPKYQIELIDDAIANGWQTIYPKKVNKPSSGNGSFMDVD